MVTVDNEPVVHRRAHTLLALEEKALLSRLVLNAHAAARICGISARQLTYWSDRGLIPSLRKRRYAIAALNKAVRIRKAMDQGYTLRRAARLVEEQLATADAERAQRAALPLPELQAQVAERLGSLLSDLGRARALLGRQAASEEIPIEADARRVLALDANIWQALPKLPEGHALALRLNRAIDELAAVLEQVASVKEQDDLSLTEARANS